MSPNAELIVSDDPLADEPELRQELAEMFLVDCPKLLLEICGALKRRDGGALKIAAHTLKGSAGVFRVQPAYNAALHMERIGSECDWDHAEMAWIEICTEMAHLSASLAGPVEPVLAFPSS